MGKNIFIKSMRRQPLRTALLAALIGLAAFAFVSRTAEFLVVQEQIAEAAKYYRTTGFINHHALFGDVRDGITLLEQSPHVAVHDSRRAAQGFMVDVINADVSGMSPAARNAIEGRYVNPTFNESYFYAYLLHVNPSFDRFGRIIGFRMVMRVDEVVAGQPEHAAEGQTLFMDFRVTQHAPYTTFDNLEVGERYFMRGAYVRDIRTAMNPPMPRVGAHLFSPEPIDFDIPPAALARMIEAVRNNPLDPLHLWPLNPNLPEGEQIWFVHAPTGTEVDFSLPGLEHLPAEIAGLRLNQSNLLLQTTRDMTAMPQVDDAIELLEGRWINHDDYLNQANVIVIDLNFAWSRGLEVGDTLTINIPRHQTYVRPIGFRGFVVPFVQVNRSYPQRFADVHQVELEIIGITNFTTQTLDSVRSLFAFVPDSVLPDDFVIDHHERIMIEGSAFEFLVNYGVDFVPDVWYSFTLGDSRYFDEFFDEFFVPIAATGMDLVVNHMDSANFWLSAQPVLIASAFNAILFWIVLLLVLGLVAFLYLRQRNKDMAIMRALGTPVLKIFGRLLLSVALIALPASLIGGVLGWQFALRDATETLAEFGESYEESIELTPTEILWMEMFGDRPMPGRLITDIRSIEFDVYLSIMWLWILAAAVFVLTMLLFVFGGLKVLNQPVLEFLQGNRGKINKPGKTKAKKGIEHEAEPVVMPMSTGYNLPKVNLPVSFTKRVQNSLNWVILHIFRARLKSALGVGVALLFIVALGWLQGSIDTTYGEIHRLYDNTIVQAKVRANPQAPRSRHIDDTITAKMHRQVLETDFALDLYREAGHVRSFVIAPEDGTMPHFWAQRVGISRARNLTWFQGFEEIIDRALLSGRDNMDITLGINNIETFLSRHVATGASQALIEVDEDDFNAFELGFSPVFEARVGQLPRSVQIELLEGFDPAVFEDDYIWEFEGFTPQNPLPIIISQTTAYLRGLVLGDHALYAYAEVLRDTRVGIWPYVHAKVVGIHNGQIHVSNGERATLMPYWAFREFVGSIASQYVHLGISIDPAFNRDLTTVRNELSRIFNLAHFEPLPFLVEVHDSELRNVTTAMEQILLLLEMMYPVAIFIAVVIGAGLALLLALQNTKNAAVLRTLGVTKPKACLMLCAEQIFICLTGLIIGVAGLLAFGRTIEQLILPALGYMGGILFGAVFGALIVTGKAPLDLLQVRE